jgi:hypothetical protein
LGEFDVSTPIFWEKIYNTLALRHTLTLIDNAGLRLVRRFEVLGRSAEGDRGGYD